MRLLLIVIALGFSLQGIAQEASSTADTTITLKVAGITCPGNLVEINKHVGEMEGVVNCEAITNPAAVTKFQVTYDPTAIRMEEVIAGVETTESCDVPGAYPFKVKQKKNKKK